MRNSLRDDLWQISLNSLLSQTSKNWKAIVVGDTRDDILDKDFFIALNFDEYTKSEKIELALDHIKANKSLNPTYLIRFDDDDIFSQDILQDIEQMPTKYDCYFDKFHTYIDLTYLKLSHKRNSWIPNTAIHKYSHAITVCGKSNLKLLVQDHSAYWHIYYHDKENYKTIRSNPIYYRVLTPFSLTSVNSQLDGVIAWQRHLNYLKGYGPWIGLSSQYPFYQSLKKISQNYFKYKPRIKNSYWIFNKLKFFKNYF